MLYETKSLGDWIVDRLVREYKLVLLENRKVATAKTFQSIRGESSTTENKAIARIYARESLTFIQSGRRPGAKLPVQRTADGFELVPLLQEWVRAVGFTGNYYLLARKIAERGIKAVPITAIVLERTRTEILERIQQETVQQLSQKVFAEIRASFRAI